MVILEGPSKTCGFTTGFENLRKLDFEVKIWEVRDGLKTSGTYARPLKLCVVWENINFFWHTLGTFWNFEIFGIF